MWNSIDIKMKYYRWKISGPFQILYPRKFRSNKKNSSNKLYARNNLIGIFRKIETLMFKLFEISENILRKKTKLGCSCELMKK